VSDNVLDYIDLNESHSFIVVNATEKIIDSTIINLDVRNKFHINVVAIRREGDIIIPKPDTSILDNDSLLLIGNNVDLNKFNEWLKK
jgi:trk system potassium uptake protein TrkA